MKTNQKILNLALSAFLVCGFVACTEEKSDDTTPSSSDGYSMTVCPVSGEELGSMGDPVVMTHKGTEVKLCCDSCVSKFESDPAKYVAMVKEAG